MYILKYLLFSLNKNINLLYKIKQNKIKYMKKIAFIAVATLLYLVKNNNEAVSTSDVDTLTVVVDTLLHHLHLCWIQQKYFQKEI
jgi:hypothetical protein